MSHVDLVAEMMKDLVNKLKLDMEPVSTSVDLPPKLEVLLFLNIKAYHNVLILLT